MYLISYPSASHTLKSRTLGPVLLLPRALPNSSQSLMFLRRENLGLEGQLPKEKLDPGVDGEGKVRGVHKSSPTPHLAPAAPEGFPQLTSSPTFSLILPSAAQDLLQRDSLRDHVPIPLRELGAGGTGPGA